MTDARIKLRWAAVLAWAAAVLVLSVLPGKILRVPPVIGAAKIAHVVVYGILALLIQHAVRKPCLRCGVVVTVVCGLFGAVMELAQVLVEGRTASVADAVANLLGAAVASALYVMWRGRPARSEESTPLPPRRQGQQEQRNTW